jgi:diguanylate cyclase (GGDEF)-like protein
LDWLRVCPTGILVSQGAHVVWANPALERMLGIPAGATEDEARYQAAAPALQELLSRDGLIGLKNEDGTERWVYCEQAEVGEGPETSLQLRFFQDVTGEVNASRERDAMRQKVKELDVTDRLTGLANRRALLNALSSQVTRSRRYQNPLALALAEVAAQGVETPLPDGVILAVSRFLRDRLRWADVIGRYEPRVFMLILPETDREAALRLLREIQEEAGDLPLPTPHENLAVELTIGLTQWRKGFDAARLVAEAETQLLQARDRQGP